MKTVHIVDDHHLFSQSLEGLINKFEEYQVAFIGENGLDLIHRLQDIQFSKPNIVLLDIRMPIMNGLETMDWMQKNFPNIPVIALTMEDDESTIIQMLRKGVKGYLLKDIHPESLKKALDDALQYGFHQNERVTKVMLSNNGNGHHLPDVHFKDKELEFIKYAATDLTYKEIAEEMKLSPKTIDGYRETLFDKVNVKSRVGLVMYAVKHKLIKF